MGTSISLTNIMKTCALLTALLSLAAAAPQRPIYTYGTQTIGTAQTQGGQTIQYAQDNLLAGVNFAGAGLQSTNTFGANTATNGLTFGTNTANFAGVPVYGDGALQYGLGLGQQYLWG